MMSSGSVWFSVLVPAVQPANTIAQSKRQQSHLVTFRILIWLWWGMGKG